MNAPLQTLTAIAEPGRQPLSSSSARSQLATFSNARVHAVGRPMRKGECAECES